MQHRPYPELTFAQARYANASHPATATFPAGCDFFASVSSGGSIAMNFLRVAVPALALVLVLLWVARCVATRLEARRMRLLAVSWAALPSYKKVRGMAAALRLKHSRRRRHHRCHRHSGSSSNADGHESGAETPVATPTSPGSPCASAPGSAPDDDAHESSKDEELQCAICLSLVADHSVELLPCGHKQFCARCLVQLWQFSGMYRQLHCPLCRQAVQLMCPVHVAGSTPSVDDVLLLEKYNRGFGSTTRLPLLDWCVLRLRAMTHARLLPIVIGLRIAVLHITMFTYMLLPSSLAAVVDGTAAAAETAALTSGASASAIAAAWNGALRAFTTIVYTAAVYADDLFVVAVSIILTGHLLQSALFKDLKL